jgi:hypothetical protein
MEYPLTPKDSALKTVGRTVVNLQRLEQHVKAVANIFPFHGTLTKIQRDSAKHREKVIGMTLGQAIRIWVATLEESPPQQPIPVDLFEYTFSQRIEFNVDEQTKDHHANELKALLTFRNDFVHGALLRINWDSDAECEVLTATLEQWITRIGDQMQFLRQFIDYFKYLASLGPDDFEIVECQD